MKNITKAVSLFLFLCLFACVPVLVLIIQLKIKSNEDFPYLKSCAEIGDLNNFFIPSLLFTIFCLIYFGILILAYYKQIGKMYKNSKYICEKIIQAITTKEGIKLHYLRIIGWSLIIAAFSINLILFYLLKPPRSVDHISPCDVKLSRKPLIPKAIQGKGNISKKQARQILLADRRFRGDLVNKLRQVRYQTRIDSLIALRKFSLYNIAVGLIMIIGVILIEIEAYKITLQLKGELQKKLRMFGK